MLISEASKVALLTKKAIEYYTDQGLISPAVLENGYRDFNDHDIESLKKISVLRKLGIGTEDIKTVLVDKTGGTLQKLSVEKELDMQRQKIKKAVLDRLSCGDSYESIIPEIKGIEQNATITEKLLEAFPGHYGRFVALHFARFLNEPILTEEQQSAYGKIVGFLDSVPPLNLPKDLQDYLDEGTKHISAQGIADMLENLKIAYQDPDKFIAEHKEVLSEYLAFKLSDDYKSSPTFQIQSLLKEFYSTSGYYDIFIPAMKQLSTAYAAYYSGMEAANEKLLAQFPEIAGMND